MDYATLLYEAQQITDETLTEANTAIRVGTWMQNSLAWMSAQLRGKSDSALAGSWMIWGGPASTIPDDWALIGNSQVWLDMTTYADLFNNLGGLASPWGVNVTNNTFSLPWCPEGYCFVQSGSTFTLAKSGGNSSVNLTVDNIAPFKVRIGVNTGGAGSLEWTNPDTTSGPRKYPLASQATSTYSSGYSDSVGQGTPLNIQPPYVATNWIIKLTNSNNSFTVAINSNGHLILTFSDGSTQDAGAVVNTNSVLFTSQTLDAEQQAVARANIDAPSSEELESEVSSRANADAALQAAINGKENVGVAQQLITSLINNSPTALDTLKQLADALGDDANFSTTITNLLGTKANETDLTTEATTRANADAALQQNLSNETTEREQSDDTIQLQIVNAVNTLQAGIANSVSTTSQTLDEGQQAVARANIDAPSSEELESEVSSRESADAALQQNITTGLAGKVDRVALLSVSDEPDSTNVGDLWYDPSSQTIFTNILTTSQVGDRTFHVYTWSNPQSPISGVVYTCNGINYIWDGNSKLAQIASYTDLASINSVVIHDETMTGNGSTANPLSVRMLELPMQAVANGAIILENPYYVYQIATANTLTVTLNTSNVDTTQYIKFYLQVNLNAYVSLSFPSNWYFANLDVPNQIGVYMYEVSSTNGGATWQLQTKYKDITSVGIDQNGNPIIGATTWFVDGQNGSDSNNGITWATAYKNIQTAINGANAGDAVFVKGSSSGITYLPTTLRTAGDPRSAAFIMKTGVNVYGGFAGTETTLYQRDMVSYEEILYLPSGQVTLNVPVPVNPSILSGNLTGTQTSSAYTVVYADSTCGVSTLNGFTISGAYDETGSASFAGVYGFGSSLHLSNCRITGNYKGGGSWSQNGAGAAYVSINNCVIDSNTGSMQPGNVVGAFSCSITNTLIFNNSYSYNGAYVSGVIYGVSGVLSSNIQNSKIYNNNSTGPAGVFAQYNYNSSCISCDISNNVSTGNPGYIAGAGTIPLINCSVHDNSSTNSGTQGTVVNSTVYSSVIYNNSNAGLSGGTYGCTVVSTSICNNYGANGSGGDYESTLINCSVLRNSGGGTYNSTLKNTVVWGNRSIAGTVVNTTNNNSSTEEYSAFENETRSGTGNISLSVNNTGDPTSPYFTVISTSPGIVDDTLVSNAVLSSISSCLVDKGLTSINPSGYGSIFDVSSFKRVCGSSIDIGASEWQQ